MRRISATAMSLAVLAMGLTIAAPQAKAETAARFPLNTSKAAIINNAGAQWCYNATSNCHHDYNAADIHVPTGTQVVSPVFGTVIAKTVASTGVGSRVQIRDNTGQIWYLAHMHHSPAPVVNVGASVQPGTPIGVVGTSSHAVGTNPHLHIDRLPSSYSSRPACSGAACSAYPFINVQAELHYLFQNLGQSVGSTQDLAGVTRYMPNLNGWRWFLTDESPEPGSPAAAATDAYLDWPGTVASDTPLMGDWYGTGKDAPGIGRFDSATGEWTFYITPQVPTPGTSLNVATQGMMRWPGTLASDRILVGDFDADGKDQIALARFGGSTWTVYITDNTMPVYGTASTVATTEAILTWAGTLASDTLLVGDYFGTNYDTLSIARFGGSTWTYYLSNDRTVNGTPVAAGTDAFTEWAGTLASDKPMLNDWYNAGKDSPGLARYSPGTQEWTYYLSTAAPAPGNQATAATDSWVAWAGTGSSDTPFLADWVS